MEEVEEEVGEEQPGLVYGLCRWWLGGGGWRGQGPVRKTVEAGKAGDYPVSGFGRVSRGDAELANRMARARVGEHDKSLIIEIGRKYVPQRLQVFCRFRAWVFAAQWASHITRATPCATIS